MICHVFLTQSSSAKYSRAQIFDQWVEGDGPPIPNLHGFMYMDGENDTVVDMVTLLTRGGLRRSCLKHLDKNMAPRDSNLRHFIY